MEILNSSSNFSCSYALGTYLICRPGRCDEYFNANSVDDSPALIKLLDRFAAGGKMDILIFWLGEHFISTVCRLDEPDIAIASIAHSRLGSIPESWINRTLRRQIPDWHFSSESDDGESCILQSDTCKMRIVTENMPDIRSVHLIMNAAAAGFACVIPYVPQDSTIDVSVSCRPDYIDLEISSDIENAAGASTCFTGLAAPADAAAELMSEGRNFINLLEQNRRINRGKAV